MSVNRQRNKSVTIRMTADELKQFNYQLVKSEAKNQTDFVLRLLPKIPNSVNYEAKEILAELKRQGNNLNQIAKALNLGTVSADAVKQAIKECNELYKKIIKKV